MLKYRAVLKIIVLLVFVSATTLTAAYYVNPNGNNDQTGTKKLPWKTISYAARQAGPGDTVYVEKGTYQEPVTISKNGQVSTPIVYMGVGKPVIGNGGNNLKISGRHIIIDGFVIRNTSKSGVIISGSNGQLRNCLIHNNNGAGITVQSVSDVTISGGKVYDNDIGISLQGAAKNLLIESVELYSTGKQRTAMVTWKAGKSRNLTLSKLRIHDHPKYGAQIMPSSSEYMHDVTVIDCHFYNNGIGSPNKLGNGFRYRPANLLVQRVVNGLMERNIFERGMGWGVDIYTSQNFKVQNNLFLNNFDTQKPKVGPGFGLEINASNGTTVFNNTFYGNETALLISYLDSGHDWPPGKFKVTVYNNIFYKSRKKDYLKLLSKYANQTTIIMNHNLMNKDPLFKDAKNGDFHLMKNSPAIDNGIAVDVTADFENRLRARGNGYDMGMHEYFDASPVSQYLQDNANTPGNRGFSFRVHNSRFVFTASEHNAKVKIVNTQGKCILNKTVGPHNTLQCNLPRGIYLVTAVSHAGMSKRKIISY